MKLSQRGKYKRVRWRSTGHQFLPPLSPLLTHTRAIVHLSSMMVSALDEDMCKQNSNSSRSLNHRDSSATSDYSSDDDQSRRDAIVINEQVKSLTELKKEEDFHLPAAEVFDAKVEFANRQERLKLHTFIRDGDFDIVWQNVLVFVVGHLTYFYSVYVAMTDPADRTRYTWFWSK